MHAVKYVAFISQTLPIRLLPHLPQQNVYVNLFTFFLALFNQRKSSLNIQNFQKKNLNVTFLFKHFYFICDLVETKIYNM